MARIFVAGNANIDLVALLAALPRAGETVAAGDLTYVPGGKGANQACAVARMGAETYLVARLGSDNSASSLIESLQRAGVRTGFYKAHHGIDRDGIHLSTSDGRELDRHLARGKRGTDRRCGRCYPE